MSANQSILPELKSGDVLLSKSGRKCIVRRIKNSGKHATAYEEPIYRLVYMLSDSKQQVGNAIWTREELQESGARMA